MNITVTIPIVIMEQNFLASVDVSITTRSQPEIMHNLSHRGWPAEGCEWEVQEIGIARATGKYLDTPEWLRNMIAESDELAEAVAAAESDEPRGRAARDPDDERERMVRTFNQWTPPK
jgi:hypothetical protein